MYRSNALEASLTAKLLQVHQEDKLLNLNAVLLAIYHNLLRLHRAGNTLGCSTRSQNVIEECNLKNITISCTCRNIAKTIEERIETILLLDAHLNQIALVEGELTALANGDDILHLITCDITLPSYGILQQWLQNTNMTRIPVR